jgi:hypothetical protein
VLAKPASWSTTEVAPFIVYSQPEDDAGPFLDINNNATSLNQSFAVVGQNTPTASGAEATESTSSSTTKQSSLHSDQCCGATSSKPPLSSTTTNATLGEIGTLTTTHLGEDGATTTSQQAFSTTAFPEFRLPPTSEAHDRLDDDDDDDVQFVDATGPDDVFTAGQPADRTDQSFATEAHPAGD